MGLILIGATPSLSLTYVCAQTHTYTTELAGALLSSGLCKLCLSLVYS